MKHSEIEALINLLDDPDDGIYSHVEQKIVSLGNEAIPVLETAWENSLNHILQVRIENLIHKIQFERVEFELTNWKNEGAQNLLDGLISIARYQYPDIDALKIREQINQIKQSVWLELRDDLTALEKVKILNKVIFDLHSFSGNASNFHAPSNSFINIVLESKKGNPLSLCCVYAIVAQSLGIPIVGVNLPELFVLAYIDEYATSVSSENTMGTDVLFYINAFSKGTVFGKKEIDSFLQQLKLKPVASHYEPCSNLDIIKRVLANLHNAYQKNSDDKRMHEIDYILKIIS